MGGTIFQHDVRDPDHKMDVGEAYASAVDDAAWEHGHGGYTGTIAEKRGYRLAVLPKNMEPHEFFGLLCELGSEGTEMITRLKPPTIEEVDDWYKDEMRQRIHERNLATFARIQELRVDHNLSELADWATTYDDKWGPAVAVQTADGWSFGGWASC